MDLEAWRKKREQVPGPSEDATETHRPAKPHLLRFLPSPTDYWLDMPKSLAWHGKGNLTQVNLRQNKGSWQAIIKRTDRGKHTVAFIECGSWVELLEAVAEYVQKDFFTWYPDKYPPGR